MSADIPGSRQGGFKVSVSVGFPSRCADECEHTHGIRV